MTLQFGDLYLVMPAIPGRSPILAIAVVTNPNPHLPTQLMLTIPKLSECPLYPRDIRITSPEEWTE